MLGVVSRMLVCLHIFIHFCGAKFLHISYAIKITHDMRLHEV